MIALGILVKSGKTEICFFRPWKRRLQETLDDFSPGMDLAIPRIAPVRSPPPMFCLLVRVWSGRNKSLPRECCGIGGGVIFLPWAWKC